MSGPGGFQDYNSPAKSPDENTIITNYWLEFVTARQETEDPPRPPRPSDGELYAKVKDFGRRIEDLLADNESIRAQLEKLHSPEPPHGAGGPEAAASGSEDAAPAGDAPRARRNRSLAEWLRDGPIGAAIRRLR